MKTSIKHKELVRKFKNLGFDGPFSGGKHLFMSRGKHKVHIPNPHKDKDVHVSLVKEILRQAEISMEEWESA